MSEIYGESVQEMVIEGLVQASQATFHFFFL